MGWLCDDPPKSGVILQKISVYERIWQRICVYICVYSVYVSVYMGIYEYMCVYELRICVYMSVYADPLGNAWPRGLPTNSG